MAQNPSSPTVVRPQLATFPAIGEPEAARGSSSPRSLTRGSVRRSTSEVTQAQQSASWAHASRVLRGSSFSLAQGKLTKCTPLRSLKDSVGPPFVLCGDKGGALTVCGALGSGQTPYALKREGSPSPVTALLVVSAASGSPHALPKEEVWVGYGDGMVQVFRSLEQKGFGKPPTGALLKEQKKHASAVTAMASSSDGVVYTASSDWKILEWRDHTPKAFGGHDLGVRTLTIVNNVLWSGGDDAQIHMWMVDANGNQRRKTLSNHTGSVISLLSEDQQCGGNGIALGRNPVVWSASSSGELMSWDARTAYDEAVVAPSVVLEHGGAINDLLWVTGQLWTVGADDIAMWSAASGVLVTRVPIQRIRGADRSGLLALSSIFPVSGTLMWSLDGQRTQAEVWIAGSDVATCQRADESRVSTASDTTPHETPIAEPLSCATSNGFLVPASPPPELPPHVSATAHVPDDRHARDALASMQRHVTKAMKDMEDAIEEYGQDGSEFMQKSIQSVSTKILKLARERNGISPAQGSTSQGRPPLSPVLKATEGMAYAECADLRAANESLLLTVAELRVIADNRNAVTEAVRTDLQRSHAKVDMLEKEVERLKATRFTPPGPNDKSYSTVSSRTASPPPQHSASVTEAEAELWKEIASQQKVIMSLEAALAAKAEDVASGEAKVGSLKCALASSQTRHHAADEVSEAVFTLNGEISRLNGRILELVEENVKASNVNEATIDKLAAVEFENDALVAEVKSLQANLDAARATTQPPGRSKVIDELTRKLEEAHENNAALRATCAQLQQQGAAASRSASTDESGGQLQQLQRELDDANAVRADLEQAVALLNASQERLEKDSAAQIQHQRTTIAALQKQLDDAEEDIRAMDDSHAQAVSSSTRSVQQERDELFEELNRTQGELHSMQRQQSQSKLSPERLQIVGALRDELEEARRRLTAAEAAHVATKTDLAALTATNDSLTRERDQARLRLAQAKESIDTLRSGSALDKGTLEKQLVDLKAQVIQLTVERDATSKALAEAKETNAILEGELEESLLGATARRADHDGRINRLVAEIEQLKVNNVEVRKQNDDAQDVIEESLQRIESLTAAMEQKEKEIALLHKSVAKAEARADAEVGQVAEETTFKVQRLQNALDDATAELRTLKDVNTELEQQLKARDEDLATVVEQLHSLRNEEVSRAEKVAEARKAEVECRADLQLLQRDYERVVKDCSEMYNELIGLRVQKEVAEMVAPVENGNGAPQANGRGALGADSPELKAVRAAYERELNVLKKRCKASEDSRNQYQRSLERMQGQMNDMAKLHKSQMDDIPLRKEVTALRRETEEQKQQIRKLSGISSELRARLNQALAGHSHSTPATNSRSRTPEPQSSDGKSQACHKTGHNKDQCVWCSGRTHFSTAPKQAATARVAEARRSFSARSKSPNHPEDQPTSVVVNRTSPPPSPPPNPEQVQESPLGGRFAGLERHVKDPVIREAIQRHIQNNSAPQPGAK